jgi:hypothetical protein
MSLVKVGNAVALFAPPVVAADLLLHGARRFCIPESSVEAIPMFDASDHLPAGRARRE